MKILVATNHLRNLRGSETFTYTIVEELVRRGFDVEYFTFEFGKVSDRIEKDLKVSFRSKTNYDLILANHNTCVDALYKFGYIIQTCHGIYPNLEQPSPKANAYVSISTEVQNHLAVLGYPSVLIHNSINLKRFRDIKPVNKELSKVLSLCHSEAANAFVEKACKKLDLIFSKAYVHDAPVWDVEQKINEADLVIGLGRSAYEAMACGRPVVVYDNRDYFESCGDGYVKDYLGFSMRNNCSGRYSKLTFNEAKFILELQKYNYADSAFFRNFAEKELDVQLNITRYLEFWKDSLEEKRRRKNTTKKQKIKGIFNALLGDKNTQRLIRFLKRIIYK